MPDPRRLRELLAGRHVLVTGATGFVGEALLARVLTDLPETRLTLLVRGRGGVDGTGRVRAMLAKPAFGAERTWPEGRLSVLDGDLARVPALPSDLDAVVHCAGEVSFDPALDAGFDTNVHGTVRLLEAVRAAGGRPHYLHVSTAYVAGRRRGAIPEAPVVHGVDWRAEAAAAATLRQSCEQASRAPAVLARLRTRAEREHSAAGPMAVASATEAARVAWVADRLVAAGRERARSLGWTDAYTFTKAMGERAVEELTGDLPVSVVRPAIIESALRHPFPGWIEGFKMAEPIILAFGRGDLPDFPGSPDTITDIIPVDHVVNAMLAVLAAPPAAGQRRYFHISTGVRNPLTFRRLHAEVAAHFTAHPLERPGLGAVPLPDWTFPGAARLGMLLRSGERGHAVADAVVTRLPASPRVRALAASLDRQQRRLEFLRRYHELYEPYVQAELEFAVDATLALHAGMDPRDREDFGFDPAEVDWTGYLRDTHCPSVTAMLRELGRRPRRSSVRAAAPVAGTPAPALAVFDMDGTVLAGTVVQSYLRLRLPGLSPLAAGREVASVAARLPGWLAGDARDRSTLLRSVYRRYRGADLAELDRLIDALSPELGAELFPAAVRRLREHRDAGHVTVLLTGGVRALTRPLLPLFDVVVATELEAGPDGRATGFLAQAPLVGEARAGWIRREAAARDIALADCFAYADSHSDLPMLSVVGHPVAVNPDVTLDRAARRARWPVESWAGAHRAPAGSRS